MFERFTDRARRVVVLAQEEARMLDHNYIGTEHLLLGLITEDSGVGAKVLQDLGVDVRKARAAVEEMIGRGPSTPSGHIPFTPRAKKVLELALRESLQLGHHYIGTEHVLLGLVREGEGVAAQMLVRFGVTLSDVRSAVIRLLTQVGGAGTAQFRTQTRMQSPVELYSPGLRHALSAAETLAADASVVGTHHVLAIFAQWDDLAANAALRAGGFDASTLDAPIAAWDVAGTRDETPEQWGARVTAVSADDEAVIIRITDPLLRDRINEQMRGGNAAGIEAVIGEAIHDVRSKLTPSVSEAGDPAEAAPAGGEEHHEEEGGPDEDDGGS